MTKFKESDLGRVVLESNADEYLDFDPDKPWTLYHEFPVGEVVRIIRTQIPWKDTYLLVAKDSTGHVQFLTEDHLEYIKEGENEMGVEFNIGDIVNVAMESADAKTNFDGENPETLWHAFAVGEEVMVKDKALVEEYNILAYECVNRKGLVQVLTGDHLSYAA